MAWTSSRFIASRVRYDGSVVSDRQDLEPPDWMQTFKDEHAAQRHCPADTVVWLNTTSSNYHFKGDAWYGRTQRGTYVCKVEADKDGMRAWTSPK